MAKKMLPEEEKIFWQHFFIPIIAHNGV